ncbi:MAG: TIM-barrel domain-containing protein [Pseudomonadota bacterium]
MRNLLEIKIWILASLGSLCLVPSAAADYGNYSNHRVEGQTLIVETDRGTLELAVINPRAVYLTFVENGVSQLPGFALAGDVEATTVASGETDDQLWFGTPELSVTLTKQNMTATYGQHGETVLAEESGYFAFDGLRGFRFQLDEGEQLLGGGERVLGMNRRGFRLPLYNRAHYGYTTQSEQMYYSLPAVMSDQHYAIVFDNSARGWLDIGRSESDVLQFEAVAGRTAYLVCLGDDYPALVETLTQAIGRQPLPPRWAFGNFASRFGYRTEAEVDDVVSRFQREDIPLDALVLDLYWFGPDIKGHMGKLDWDNNAFPSPEAMIERLDASGVKTILISEPFVLTTSNRWQEAVNAGVLASSLDGQPKTFDFYFGNTGLIDIFKTDAQQWLGDIYERQFDQGIAGVWGDLGEPEVHPDDTIHQVSETGQQATGAALHNAYGHNWAKMVFERYRQALPAQRPFIMMRSGFVGTQRYGIIPWTGDVDRSWGGLQSQVELSLQMGLFGLGYVHSDLGGFAGGDKFDRELYLRWLQMGVFQPVFRPHAQEHIAPEPVFHDKKTRRIARDAIRLRYSLLPYIQTLAHDNASRGLPFVRPILFETADSFERTDAYLFGDAFLVAPVTQPRVRTQTVTLPPGVWFDWYSGERYDEGVATVRTPLEHIPVLVRAGAFVPMTDAVATTRDYSTEALTLHYFDDKTVRAASSQMIEDDGRSASSLEDGALDVLAFDASRDDQGLTITLSRKGDGYDGMPLQRRIRLEIHNQDAAPRVSRISGLSSQNTDSGYLPKEQTFWFSFSMRNETLEIRIDDAN